MDAKTRAEKMIEFIKRNKQNHPQAIQDWIIIQISEAVKDASAVAVREVRDTLMAEMVPKTDIYQKGFASAREKAAGIADLHSSQSFGYSREIRGASKELAERIRAMSPSDETGVSPMEAGK